MVPYTLLLHTYITGTFGICTIDFKITYILDTSSIFMFVATIEIMQSTTKSWYVVYFLMLYYVHCYSNCRPILGWGFDSFYFQTVVFMSWHGNWVKDIDFLLLCIDQPQESRWYLAKTIGLYNQNHPIHSTEPEQLCGIL